MQSPKDPVHDIPDAVAMDVVLNSVSEHVVYHDRDLCVMWANRSAIVSMGARPEEVLGKTCHSLWHDRDAPCEGCPLPQVVRTGQPAAGEFHSDGRSWFIRGYPVRGADGSVEGVVEISLEITDFVTVRQRLMESESRSRALLDTAPDGIVVFEPDSGRYVMANRQAARMHGFDSVEAFLGAGLSPKDFVREPWQMDSEAMMESCRQGRMVEMRLVRPDGSEIVVESKATLIPPSGPGQPIRVLAVHRDLTVWRREQDERRRLEARMQEAQRLESLAVLAGGVAHDFNNLLMAILGNAGLALMDLPADGKAADSVRQIEQAAMRASELTRQLLAYAGRGRFDLRTVDLSALVSEMSVLLSVTLSKGTSIRHELDGHLPLVDADPGQMRQVVMNLITNAAEAIGDRPGTIRIRTGVVEVGECDPAAGTGDDGLAAGPYAFVEISDDGCGMDEETRARIFDPFFSTKFPGRGLGLPSTLGIVRSHRGTIRVDSSPGRGSTFRVLLPAGQGAPGPAEPAAESAWRGHGTLLVVDDEEAVLGVACRMLEQDGFQVLAARDGHEAIETFRAHADNIRAVLLDLTMPRVDGIEVRRRIRELRPDVPVLLSSGYGPDDAALRQGVDEPGAFIEKPYRLRDLRERFRALLGDSRTPDPALPPDPGS